MKADLRSSTGYVSSGSNVIHNHAALILVVAPADAGPRLGENGVAWLMRRAVRLFPGRQLAGLERGGM